MRGVGGKETEERDQIQRRSLISIKTAAAATDAVAAVESTGAAAAAAATTGAAAAVSATGAAAAAATARENDVLLERGWARRQLSSLSPSGGCHTSRR